MLLHGIYSPLLPRPPLAESSSDLIVAYLWHVALWLFHLI